MSLPSLLKYTVAAVVSVAEIRIFLSQRRSSPLSYLSLLSLKSVFPYIATVAETRLSTTAAIVATGAIIWKPGFIYKQDSDACFVLQTTPDVYARLIQTACLGCRMSYFILPLIQILFFHLSVELSLITMPPKRTI